MTVVVTRPCTLWWWCHRSHSALHTCHWWSQGQMLVHCHLWLQYCGCQENQGKT
jgi:hypothetical protein